MEAATVAARILQAANNVAVTPTREEDSENEFQSLLTTTRQSFRRRDSGTTPSRGRKRSRTFTRKVFIMRLANANFFPGKKEQQFLKDRGLGFHLQEEDLLLNIDTQDEIEFPCLPEEAEVKLINLKRDEVVETMFDIYKNEKDICDFKLGVKFIGEDGIDGGGLTNEMFSIFWSSIFANGKYFQGNDVFVPHVPFHKVKKVKNEFQVLGKILGHMILLTQTVPHKLALYTLTGLSNKCDDYCQNNSDLLLQDFLLLITTAERRLLHKALYKFDELSSFERNRLISFYSANALYDLPKAEEIKEQVLAIAEKLLIDQPKPLYKELQKGLPADIADFLNNMSYKTVNSIWYKMQPTPTKVMGALKLIIKDPTNDEDRYFYYLQNYVGSLTLNQLNTFLLFVTGSVQMPKEILVGFHTNSGIARRPIAHTCGNLIEIGMSYETQQELNREMDCYLNDPSSYEYNLI
ncbi:unnamed protein product [Psylliodes chrysocephalus]|uniref:HECT-type E3 ubiquitin transferase n=1 Tax=Psylliodes chrysocephalus TaxID=3402493 RepID=A0A9P0GL99_9CUCU|nr:unnamed protein product [Psylliodes chrysocephala]